MIEIIGQIDDKISDVIRKAYEATLCHLGQEDEIYVELTIVNGDEIRQINRESRGVDSVTDILSFPTIEAGRGAVKALEHPKDLDYETGALMMGELVLCMSRATEQAEEYGHSLEREVGFLVTHGTLHLFGFDHMVECDEKEMFSKQKIILDGIGLTR